MAKKQVIPFLIALGESPELRAEFDDDDRRDELLKTWGVSGHPALRRGASLSEVKEAVAKEDPQAQLEWWILAGQAPISDA